MRRGFSFQGLFPGCLTGTQGHPRAFWRRLEGVEITSSADGIAVHLNPRPRALRSAVNRLDAAIPAAIVVIVAVSMGIGAALLGYPVWAIPLIAILGAGGAIAAFRVFR